jgi:bacterioferritin (cytochrome b1)
MLLNNRELWLLNFYRNSELHGALLMGRLARTLSGADLLANITRHCATEAHHAALLTELIAELGGALDPKLETMQEHYSREGGVPTELVDLLVLSETLEHRVLKSYREHLSDSPTNGRVREVLEEILEEEEEHGGKEDAWIEQALDMLPPVEVGESRRKWQEVDSRVAAQIHAQLDNMFPQEQEKVQ